MKSAYISSRRRLWTREETMMVFNLYLKIPIGQIHHRHPDISKLVKVLRRSPLAVVSQMERFASLDPQHSEFQGGSMSNVAEEVWNEFNSNPERVILESEELLRRRAVRETGKQPPLPLENENVLQQRDGKWTGDFTSAPVSMSAESVLPSEYSELPPGETRRRLVNTRANQSLFRQIVLSAYESRCCMTGIAVPELLVASHIVPWSKNPEQRINPRNGLCLNALHDRAFDRRLISVSGDLTVRVSPKLKRAASESGNENINFVVRSEGRAIATPHRFAPEREFLEYHRRNIFQQ